MSVSSVSSAASSVASTTSSSTSTTSSTSSSDSTTSTNTFLSLLSTELENQDPLNPTDTAQFTSQLVELTGVEQQQASNNWLSTISTQLSTLIAAQETTS